MKKVLTAITCAILAACSCNDSKWEEVDNATYEEVVFEENAPVVENVVVEPTPVYVEAPQAVVDCPCTEKANTTCNCSQAQTSCQCQAPVSCYQPVCQTACGCQQAPEPKVTTTKKIITTTTTLEEPCGKDVCEPVVTVHEEIITDDGTAPVVNTTTPTVQTNNVVTTSSASTQKVVAPQNEYVEVTVEKNPYLSEVVDMRAKPANVSVGTTANYSPEAYIVVATRATNRMLQDTAVLYEEGTKRVYIKDIKLLSSDLPYGSHRLKGATKDIISGSKTFDVVNNINNADFVIEPSAEWYVGPNNATPAIQYKLSLKDSKGKKIDEWIEIIRQVKE